MAALMADEELRKTFVETQSRLQDLTRQLNSCKAQIFQRDRHSRMADITVQELEALKQTAGTEGDLVTYKAVGKMFMRMELPEIQSELKEGAEKDRREINVLQKTREYLEKNVADQERSMKELLTRR